MKQLEDSQLETFNTEYVTDQRWKIIKAQIDKDFPNGNFNFLDVGGGNGVFADRLLEYYPKSKGTVLDNARVNALKFYIIKNTYESVIYLTFKSTQLLPCLFNLFLPKNIRF